MPLLVSVRSGARDSMPGMMDTILNLGLNSKTLPGRIKMTQNERFGYDAYRRFIQLFGSVALGMPDEDFDHIFNNIKEKTGSKDDTQLDAAALKEASGAFLDLVSKKMQAPFPEDPYVQLELAIEAVFRRPGWERGRWITAKSSALRRRWRTGPQ